MSDEKQQFVSTVGEESASSTAAPAVAIGVNNGTVNIEQNSAQGVAQTATMSSGGSEGLSQTVTMSSANDCPPEKGSMSKGEKLYNRIVYQGLNYWANLAISLVVTDVFAHGSMKGWFDKAVGGWTKGMMKTGFSEKTSEYIAKQALGTFTLNSGGNILLVPTKFLEDGKRPLVHWLNKHVYHDKQLAADGHEKTPDEIYIEHEQPKQGWGRMIYRRALGWGTTTLVGIGLDKALAQKLPTPYMEKGHMVTHKKGQDVFTDAVVGGVTKTMTDMGATKLAQNETLHRYMGYAALDSIYTMITSAILHATNGADKGKEPKEIGDDAAPAVDPNSRNTLHYMPLAAEPAETETRSSKLAPESFKSNGRASIVSKATHSHVDRARLADESTLAMAP